jgi:glycosyltransferase involved in cell wall biosynthesis
MKPEISVIIPALNEERYIGYPLEGLKSQSFRNFETIVVDGGSSDRTAQIAKKAGCRVVIHRKGDIAAARNRGVRAARGDLIMFTNADTRASKNLLGIYHELFKNKGVVAASGPLIPLEQTTRFIRFGYKFASVYLAKISYHTGKPAISGSNFIVRKSAFKKCGGFDESLVTYEDLDLAHRLAKVGEVRYVNNAVVATSTRRIVKWGVFRYILFNTSNVIRYNLFHDSNKEYEPIR